MSIEELSNILEEHGIKATANRLLVAKALNEQGADAEGRECGVVLLPPVEDV